jgi:electron transport complex protein RnfC
LPLELGRAAIQNRVNDLKSLDVVSCIECGSCSYVCPAKIQLVQLMRLGKAHVRNASVPAHAKKGAV